VFFVSILYDFGFIWHRMDLVAGCCEHSNEPWFRKT